MKFKYVLWMLLIGFLGLLIYQNQGVFLVKYSLDINLGFARYHIPEFYAVVMIAVFFCVGLFIAFASGLFERYRAHKTIRSMKQTMDSYSGTIASLKQEVEALKPSTHSALDLQSAAPEPVEASDSDATPT